MYKVCKDSILRHSLWSKGLINRRSAKRKRLELRRKYLSMKYAVKIASTPHHSTYHYLFDDRYDNLYERKLKLPTPLYVKIKIWLEDIGTIRTIERTHGKIAPRMVQPDPTNTDLADKLKTEINRIKH